MQYHWRFNDPAGRLLVHMQNYQDGEFMFDATLSLRREPLRSAALVGLLFAHPAMTLKVIAAIHWQALRLWWKKTPVHDHPRSIAALGTKRA